MIWFEFKAFFDVQVQARNQTVRHRHYILSVPHPAPPLQANSRKGRTFIAIPQLALLFSNAENDIMKRL